MPNTLPTFAIFLIALALIASRSPGVVWSAEFWAEDGWFWYPDAYAHPWTSLIQPHAGYLQTACRLIGTLAQTLPLAWAPTFFNLSALAIQAIPPAYLASGRLAEAIPNQNTRLALALLWIGMPNTQETFVNVTNAQWHLATLAFLILFATPPRSALARGLDIGALLLSGLSGPYSIALTPIAAFLAWRRHPTQLTRLAVVAGTAAVQLLVLHAHPASRVHTPLGASAMIFVRIVSQQIILGLLIGPRAQTTLQKWLFWDNGAVPLAIFAAAAAMMVVAWARGPKILRLACLFAGSIFAAALAHPLISLTDPQWPVMQIPCAGQRYYYLPMLAWLGVLLCLFAEGNRMFRGIAAGALSLMVVAMVSHWRIDPQYPTNFVTRARVFERSPPGTRFSFPVDPPPFGRAMVLQK